MNLFVLSWHGSDSFAAFLNEVIAQKTTWHSVQKLNLLDNAMT